MDDAEGVCICDSGGREDFIFLRYKSYVISDIVL